MKVGFPATGVLLKQTNPVVRIREELLQEDLQQFHEILHKVLEVQRGYLTQTEYAIYNSGKKLRPLMMMLSARMVHGPDNPLPQKVVQGAVSLEMLHVATLIHDDIIDDALVRRGMGSVNAVRGPNEAIIVGDMQFVQAIRSFVDAIDAQKDMEQVKLVLDTAFKICAGELDELRTDSALSTRELYVRYMDTIDRKTAVLFGLACETGVALADGRASDARRVGFYGRRVGRAFQMMDDLLDFVQDDTVSGKMRGMDLSRRRVSLPIIYAMEELGPEHAVHKIMDGRDFTAEDLRVGIEGVIRCPGFARAYSEARTQILNGLNYLALFPVNRFRRALEDIAMYVVDRPF